MKAVAFSTSEQARPDVLHRYQMVIDMAIDLDEFWG